MPNCARLGCVKRGANSCSVCLREIYCGGDCQKGDWKSHKLICKTLKKLSHQIEPYKEVVRIIEEIQAETTRKNYLEIRVLSHVISYAEFQFGNRVAGKAYRKRKDGELIDNWTVEITILLRVYSSLVDVYLLDKSMSLIVLDNLIFPCYKKMLDHLTPWSVYVNLKPTSKLMGTLSKDQINQLLRFFAEIEHQIAAIHIHRDHFDQANIHCKQGLTYARLFEGQEIEMTEMLSKALRKYSELRRNEYNFDDAVVYSEEAYNCVAITYNPVHPKVQEAASLLIENLIHKGDLSNAERFSQVTLDSLRDPKYGLDQQSEEVADGYFNLGNVINQQKGDFVKAEELAREALRIRTGLFDQYHQFIGYSVALLARILQSQGKLGNETKELVERSLSIDIKHNGPYGANTGVGTSNMGNYYMRVANTQKPSEAKNVNLRLAQSNYKQALLIFTKIYGPNNQNSQQMSANISTTSRLLSEKHY